MRMRYLLIVVAALGLVVWVSLRMPIPGIKMQPVQPNPTIHTFQQAVAEHKQMDLAASYGAMSEDPKLHAMRKAVLEAAQVDAFPCSARWRGRLAEALRDFSDFYRDRVGQPPLETRVIDGRAVDASGYLNQETNQVLQAAMLAGVVHRTTTGYIEVPDPEAPVGPALRSASVGDRFVCDNPS